MNQTPHLLEQARQRAAEAVATSSATAPDTEMSFKQLVARKAEDNGILFMPVPNRYHEGKQIYRFANLTIYLDRAVVFVYNNSNSQWFPTSLPNLVDSAT